MIYSPRIGLEGGCKSDETLVNIPAAIVEHVSCHLPGRGADSMGHDSRGRRSYVNKQLAFEVIQSRSTEKQVVIDTKVEAINNNYSKNNNLIFH